MFYADEMYSVHIKTRVAYFYLQILNSLKYFMRFYVL